MNSFKNSYRYEVPNHNAYMRKTKKMTSHKVLKNEKPKLSKRVAKKIALAILSGTLAIGGTIGISNVYSAREQEPVKIGSYIKAGQFKDSVITMEDVFDLNELYEGYYTARENENVEESQEKLLAVSENIIKRKILEEKGLKPETKIEFVKEFSKDTEAYEIRVEILGQRDTYLTGKERKIILANKTIAEKAEKGKNTIETQKKLYNAVASYTYEELNPSKEEER